MYLFYCPDIPLTPGVTFALAEEESAHAVRVLRHTIGDCLHVTNGRGVICEARITNPHPKHCELEVLSTMPQPKHHRGTVHIAVAPTKNVDRMEWLAEKCTEIGLDTLTQLLCHYSERKQLRTDRLEKIILSAAKQSLSAYLPVLHPLTSVEDVICSADEPYKFIAHSSSWEEKTELRDHLSAIYRRSAGDAQPQSDEERVLVLIGPEGGFSDEEVRLAMEHGFVPVSLGNARLRTETAAIVACAMINFV